MGKFDTNERCVILHGVRMSCMGSDMWSVMLSHDGDLCRCCVMINNVQRIHCHENYQSLSSAVYALWFYLWADCSNWTFSFCRWKFWCEAWQAFFAIHGQSWQGYKWLTVLYVSIKAPIGGWGLFTSQYWNHWKNWHGSCDSMKPNQSGLLLS